MAKTRFTNKMLARVLRSTALTLGLLVGGALLIGAPRPVEAGETGDVLVEGAAIWASRDGKPCPGKNRPASVVYLPITDELLEAAELHGSDLSLALSVFSGKNTQVFDGVNEPFDLLVDAVSLDSSGCYAESPLFSRSAKTGVSGVYDSLSTVFVSDAVCTDAGCACHPLSQSASSLTSRSTTTRFIRVTVKWKKKKKAVGTGLQAALAPAR